MEVIKLILEIINTLAIIGGVIMAIIGVNTWKKQLKGSTEYELAKRYLKSVYKIRDAVKYVRNPFISSDEMVVAVKVKNVENPDYSNNQQTNRAVYSVRCNKVIEASTDLDVELLEAEVLWGERAVEVVNDLNNQKNKLYISLKMFLENRNIRPDRDIIYDMGDQDTFNLEIKKAIEKIEDFIKPHLK